MAAIITAGCTPSRSRAVKSAAYDTDSVEPLASGIGRLTFHADVTQAATRSDANSAGLDNVKGRQAITPHVPPITPAPTYSRDAIGSCEARSGPAACAPKAAARQPA